MSVEPIQVRLEAIRDESVPEMLRNLAGLLSGDEIVMAKLAIVAAGRPLEAGETVEFQYDIRVIGALLARVASWADASMSEKDATRHTAEATERLAEFLREQRDRSMAPRLRGAARSAEQRKLTADAHAEKVIAEAKKLIAAGREPREVVGIIHGRALVPRSDRWIRSVLRKAEIK